MAGEGARRRRHSRLGVRHAGGHTGLLRKPRGGRVRGRVRVPRGGVRGPRGRGRASFVTANFITLNNRGRRGARMCRASPAGILVPCTTAGRRSGKDRQAPRRPATE